NTVRSIAGISRDSNRNTCAVVAILNGSQVGGTASVLDTELLDLYRQPKLAKTSISLQRP
ncbi:D-alanyl-D-alanine carboxypeptidase/D-alanyl-D-alanine-endopeptidase, partial [Pseudomonas sp. AH2 (2023)]|nr:D-alanyl-D-alanine carboxypeptidase/D-alanyl-D-alanine-endopeptidase [Pseudomonas sp. AH2 (2023)]